MFGSVGGPEIMGLLVIALLLFGPRKLPEMGRTLGKAMQQFRRAATDFRADLEREVRDEKIDSAEKTLKSVSQDIKGSLREVRAAFDPTAPIPSPPTSEGYDTSTVDQTPEPSDAQGQEGHPKTHDSKTSDSDGVQSP